MLFSIFKIMFNLTKMQVFFAYSNMVKKYILFALIFSLFSGCYYSVYSNAYPHLKTIRMDTFENRSAEFALEDKALADISLAIRNDGRLKVVTANPDCVIEGKIISFEEKIYSYNSANQVQDYQISIVFDIIFTDLSQNEDIYKNSTLRVAETYKVADGSTSRFETKDEALSEIFKQVFKQVVQNTLEAW